MEETRYRDLDRIEVVMHADACDFVMNDRDMAPSVLRLVRYEGQDEEVTIPEGISIIGQEA